MTFPDDLETTAHLIVARVLSVYREEYIEKCVQEEPDSLLALIKRMEHFLIARDAGGSK